MKNSNVLSALLREMGLSDLEAKVYIWLLENKRSTGYKIAVQIGKPVANTYKALRSLEKKGAVVCDESSHKTYFDTIPVEEFLNKIEKEFIKQRKKIINEVKKLDVQQEPIGIYELQSEELVYEKAIGMIKTAENTLLIDCFPTPMKIIKEHFTEKRSKEISIYVKNYSGEDIDNVNQIKAVNTELPYTDLEGQWLIVLKDTTESLVAYFNKDGTELNHCVWIKDPFISFILFNGSAHEFNFTEVYEKVYNNEDNKIEKIKSVIERYHNIYKFMRFEEKNIFGRKK